MNSADTLKTIPAVIESDTGRFEVLSVLGQGGMGVVYKCRQVSLDRIVAIKMLHSAQYADLHTVQRLRQEALAAGGVDDENIRRVFSLGTSNGQPFIIMEYVEGRALSEVLEESQRLPVNQVITIFNQIAAALTAIHKRGLIHRDIKPSNILITTGGAAKLMDFGIAKQMRNSAEQRMTQTGVMIGSPWYMSPEQCSGVAVDGRSDIYSLGCTMYEALAGHPPFAGDNPLEVMFKHLHEQVDTLSGAVDPKLADIVTKCMAKDPNARFQTAEELHEALGDSNSGDYQPQHSRRRIRLRKLKRRWMKPIMLFAICAGLCVVSFIGWQHSENIGHTSGITSPEDNSSAETDVHSGELLSANRVGVLIDRLIKNIDALPKSAETAKKRLELFHRALALSEKGLRIAREEHNQFVECELLSRRANLYDHFDGKQAEESYRQCLDFADKAFLNPGRRRGTWLTIYTSALQAVLARKSYKHYDEWMQRALKIAGDGYRETPGTMAQLAGLKVIQFRKAELDGNHSLAEKHVLEAIDLYHEAAGDQTAMQSQAYACLGSVYQNQRRWKELAPFTERAIVLNAGIIVDRDVALQTRIGLCELGANAYTALGKHADAERLWKMAIAVGKQTNRVPKDVMISRQAQIIYMIRLGVKSAYVDEFYKMSKRVMQENGMWSHE